MFSMIVIIAAIVSAALWIYDSLACLPKRLRDNKEEPAYVAYARGIFLIAAFLMLVKILNVNILTLLVILTVFSGITCVLDKKLWRKAREARGRKDNFIIDYSRSLFWIFFIVLLVRAFGAQLFTVPTGSLEPTVMPGDILLVNQFSYGLRLPITHTKILPISEPKLGDIAVFRYPVKPSIDYIKRIVGVPGDKVVYKNKTLYINGKKMPQTFLKNTFDYEPTGNIPAKLYEEDLQGVKHQIITFKNGGETTPFSITVPKGYYLAFGDNRDDSLDSRFWGLVPEKNFIGKAMIVLLSFDSQNHRIRWHRSGDLL